MSVKRFHVERHSVTTDDIANSAITTDKIATYYPSHKHLKFSPLFFC